MLSKFNNAQQFRQSKKTGGFVCLVLLFIHGALCAQTQQKSVEMPKDERGKYIYYELVEQSAIPMDSLVARTIKFLEIKKVDGLERKNGALQGSGKMVINKTAFVLTHPSGEVWYTFALEFKDEKYRFWLTDFLFIPYKRDRYSNFVPATVKGTPLENNPGKLNEGEWASYVTAVGNHAASFAQDLKNHLSATQKIKSPKVIQKNNW